MEYEGTSQRRLGIMQSAKIHDHIKRVEVYIAEDLKHDKVLTNLKFG